MKRSGLIQTWKALGAPTGANNALVCAQDGVDIARTIKSSLSPARLLLLDSQPPPPKARFETTDQSLEQLAQVQAGEYDLVACGPGWELGDLSQIRSRLSAIHTLLAPDGILVGEIATFAAPHGDGDFNDLLFPHLARAGELTPDRQIRPALTASSWMLLIQSSGFHPHAVDDAGGQSLPLDFVDLHKARLAAFDAVELTTGVLRFAARQRELSE